MATKVVVAGSSGVTASQLKNLSADDLKRQGTGGVTLLERLLHEFVYHSETGKHLDVKKVTLCSASRGSDGSVPCVCWGSVCHGVSVGGCSPDCRSDSLRARAVS